MPDRDLLRDDAADPLARTTGFFAVQQSQRRAGVPNSVDRMADRSALVMAALQGLLRRPPCGATGIAGILTPSRSPPPHEIIPFQRRTPMTPPASAPAIKVVKSVREQVSAEEWQTRVDLAACYRLTAMYGMTEMIANHISCRVPGSHDQFLINPYGMLYEEIDASCLIKIDVDGNVLFNASDYNVNAAGFVIHSAIHMARHDVDCVAHTHTPAGMAVSAMECGLLPLAQTSMRFLHIGYHDFEGIADDVGERERLVRDLGDHEAMVLRNHGLLVVGRTIPATFNILYRMERACEVQVMALSCNTKLVYPPQDVLEKTFDKVKPRPNLPNRNGDLAWPALLRKLDRADISYRK
jgi:ribulose-5-phosphate 4-epimerase/fuculose-1-phosphate aldolase